MTTDGMSRPAGDSDLLTLEVVQQQARRYLEARYGKDVWFRAPETFSNMLERWIWAVASGVPLGAELSMTEIEAYFREARS